MRFAFVACQDTISTNPGRRADAFEHDLEYRPIKAAFDEAGHDLQEVDWRRIDPENSGFDVLLLRTVWDYTDNLEAFLSFLKAAECDHIILNDRRIVEWNCSKLYLEELADKGLGVIPSLFPEAPVPLGDIFDHFGCTDIVVKQVVGAGGFYQARYRRGLDDEKFEVGPGRFAQPFMAQIEETGEFSYIFLNGRFSHAVAKHNEKGDYRIQSLYGGYDRPHAPGEQEIAEALRFVEALPVPGFAIRVDAIRGTNGLLLMELEAIEPYLYPEHEPDFGIRFRDAALEAAAAQGKF